ncbi:MAG: 2-oxoglutarate dehydrogenase complex dihydrolipoyllysine-residue succinyltransferase [Pseudomonadota bacterium]
MIDIVVPSLGESISEATVSKWLVQSKEQVRLDQPLLELETDKITVEVNAPSAGTLAEIAVKEGESVEIGAVLGRLEKGEGPSAAPAKDEPKKDTKTDTKNQAIDNEKQDTNAFQSAHGVSDVVSAPKGQRAMPAAARLAAESGVDLAKVTGTGRGGRITRADVADHVARGAEEPSVTPSPTSIEAGQTERKPMSKLRQTIASRLKQAQNTAAILTTFNEIDMSALMDLRARYKDRFAEKYQVKLGFMSAFVRASVLALHDIPAVNARIDDKDIVYHNYANIGVAVSTKSGLVVPTLFHAQDMSFRQIELTISKLAQKASAGQLSLDDLQGGTFTISNGGVFGSMMSTPILNPPQSAILGMHAINQRPVAIDGEIKIRPMMYVALSYDHRIIDGSEAVRFLVRIKELIEDPARLVLEV